MKKLSIEFFTRSDRHETISSINEAISASGGYVDDVNFFSNIAVAIIGIFPPGSSEPLANALLAMGLKLGPLEISRLMKLDDELSAGQEFTCAIHVTFIHNEPDLKQHIPNVPG